MSTTLTRPTEGWVDRPDITGFIPAIDAHGDLFPIEKMAAHQSGQLHLAVSVFVFDDIGRLLVQRRAAGKYHCAGQWANSCCSHPHWNEAPATGAARRLREELGLTTPLEARGIFDYRADVTNGLIEHERVHLFSGRIASSDPVGANPEEVAETRWAFAATLKREAARKPAHFAPWFRIYLRAWDRLGVEPRVTPA
jgi:isopentenyl-diphosphate Delta-isomerase